MFKYHFQIVSSWDPTDVVLESMYFMVGESMETATDFPGYDTYAEADAAGEIKLSEGGYDPDQYYVKVIQSIDILKD